MFFVERKQLFLWSKCEVEQLVQIGRAAIVGAGCCFKAKPSGILQPSGDRDGRCQSGVICRRQELAPYIHVRPRRGSHSNVRRMF